MNHPSLSFCRKLRWYIPVCIYNLTDYFYSLYEIKGASSKIFKMGVKNNLLVQIVLIGGTKYKAIVASFIDKGNLSN